MPSNRGLRQSKPATGEFSTDAGRSLEPVPQLAPAPAAESTARRRRPHLPPIAGQTTRITVDVPTTDHRALKHAAESIADDLGVGSVALGQLMAGMAHVLLNDTSLRFRDSVSQYLSSRVEQ